MQQQPHAQRFGGKEVRKPQLPQYRAAQHNEKKPENSIKSLTAKVGAYNATADLSLLQEAFKFCKKKHYKQERESGEPYFTHPLAVAHILAERKLDIDSVITGLLHDVVEDTQTSTDEIAETFSPAIAELVNGVTKLTDLEKQSLAALHENETQIKTLGRNANYRKMFIAISRDVRVLLVKLADRLHNMRTLDFVQNEEKRNRIARETLLIYAPLAERIGIYLWKSELQDLAFRQLNGKAYREIKAHLKQIAGDKSKLQEISDDLTQLLADNNIKAQVTNRLKNPASIWQKMEKRGIALRDLADIMAFRIIVDNIDLCYRTLGIIHSQFPAFANGFNDYISSPKPNGYRSLHTAVSGPDKHLIEIQIRTHEMHDISENGIAAHWRYKNDENSNKKPNKKSAEKHRQHGGLAGLRDTMARLEKMEEDPETAMQEIRLDLYQDQVFCFTPKHDVIALSSGSVLLDFAYAVHTEIGHKCIGGLVNGKERPLNHLLQNGDRVDILNSPIQTPHESWKEIAQTQNAKSAIRHYFNVREKQQKIKLGEDRIKKFFKFQDAQFSEEILRQLLEKFQDSTAMSRFSNKKISTPEDLYYAVALHRIEPEEVLAAAYPGYDERLKKKSGMQKFITNIRHHLSSDSGILIANHPDTHFAIHFASCCLPVPGDKVIGIKTIGLGISLHRLNCAALQNVIAMKERWIEATWSKKFYGNRTYKGRIEVILKNNPGALGKACTIIGEQNVNIGDLKFSQRISDFYVVRYDLDVTDISQIAKVIGALSECSEINSVTRV